MKCLFLACCLLTYFFAFFKVTASNEYGDSSLFGRGYPWLEGKLVVEPYKLTHLKAGTGTDEKGDYEWTIRGEALGREEDNSFYCSVFFWYLKKKLPLLCELII